jgi:Tfp pilus assembly protein PilV
MTRTRIRRPVPARQRGSFLLESLIAVFVVALAILGLVGLIGRSIQNVDESKFRAEAAAIATSYVGQMWIDDRTPAALKAKYESGGAAYNELKAFAAQRLPNAVDPVVAVVAGATANSSDVTVTLQWQAPGDKNPHFFQTFATVGANN